MLILYKGYKYDNSYDYIKTFRNKTDQENYFNSLSKIRLDETNYIKQHLDFIIDISFDELVAEGVNYIQFNNGYKDIFAFIIEKQYINDKNTRIIYEIDVIQTYMFDFTIKKSFVERKVCTIDEITDFDEGLNIGEHVVESSQTVLNKNSTYFAMFNGIKEQQLIFNENGIVQNVVDMPFSTSKPLTLVDGIQYPCYFMPLNETYAEPSYENINNPSGGGGGTEEENSVVNSARKLLGKPYVWGGNYPPLGTDSGTDCSGLIMWAFNDAGLLQNVGLGGRWTTKTMIEHATGIPDIYKAKVSDVIFSNFSSPGVPNHVVLISELLGGNSVRIIEAQQTGTDIMERVIEFDGSKMEVRRLL